MNALTSLLIEIWKGTITHLWQTTLVIGILLLLGRALRRAPARTLYFLWAAAFLKAFLPLPLLGAASLRVLGLLAPGLLARRAAVTPGGFAFVVDPAGVWSGRGEVHSALTQALVVVFSLAWIAGAVLLLLRVVRDWKTVPHPQEVTDREITVPDRMNLSAAARAASVDASRVSLMIDPVPPHVRGFFRPRIMLSLSTLRSLAPEEVAALLLHEEAHRRRRDPLRTLFVRLGSSLLFFYPLLPFLRRRIQQAAEFVCDEEVIRSGVRPGTYARALARTIEDGIARDWRAFSAGSDGAGNLRARFARIRAHRPAARWEGAAAAGTVTFIVLGSILPLHFLAGCGRDTPKRIDSPGQEASPTPSNPGIPAEPGGETPSNPTYEAPVLVEFPDPGYPAAAKKARIEGTVFVRMRVDREGSVKEAFVSTGVSPDLDAASLAAARKARFKPARENGKPMETWVQVPIRYNAD